MRDFQDENGRRWIATLAERPGVDYKGRYYLTMVPEDDDGSGVLALSDIRWNSERTARRTVETMSVVELRRRLRQAEGRAPGLAPSGS